MLLIVLVDFYDVLNHLLKSL